jgi:lipoprotein signal peptidase
MPANKHKRKATSHVKSTSLKSTQSSGLISSHPKAFVMGGLFFVALGLYLLAFESQNNAMFGVAMLSLIAGGATTIYANFTVSRKK